VHNLQSLVDLAKTLSSPHTLTERRAWK
jgi:hypothetical protein